MEIIVALIYLSIGNIVTCAVCILLKDSGVQAAKAMDKAGRVVFLPRRLLVAEVTSGCAVVVNALAALLLCIAWQPAGMIVLALAGIFYGLYRRIGRTIQDLLARVPAGVI